ncbi:hypothetical protein SKAU_G00412140 [Synaphobranchus kaupii]|uniref:Uncharacterized protein n=1 Tax=Synaphobranchus kaupii TaxID=118154 RepID=A0A9Q1E800_SYNKA|nr:hypothetical protein SKAU_G00412140 [Synaphobranchus kaupii]
MQSTEERVCEEEQSEEMFRNAQEQEEIPPLQGEEEKEEEEAVEQMSPEGVASQEEIRVLLRCWDPLWPFRRNWIDEMQVEDISGEDKQKQPPVKERMAMKRKVKKHTVSSTSGVSQTAVSAAIQAVTSALVNQANSIVNPFHCWSKKGWSSPLLRRRGADCLEGMDLGCVNCDVSASGSLDTGSGGAAEQLGPGTAEPSAKHIFVC